jgi:phage terminase small subunit
MALTAKQERFVAEYLIDLNATQAAIRAGYSAKTAEQQGARLLGNAKVAAAIAAGQAARAERTNITQDYVLSSIVETMERCKQAKQVLNRRGEPVLVETPTGEMVPAYVFDAGNVLRGAEMLGKHLGMFGGDGGDDDDAKSLNINLTVSSPVGDVRVTRPDT